jgi:endonuclease/exonuclease/phosphatase family metal-dependent hydrolase
MRLVHWATNHSPGLGNIHDSSLFKRFDPMRRLDRDVCTFRTVLLAVVALTAAADAAAQKTVVLDAPGSEVVDTVVRGGEHAARNFDGEVLITRRSSSTDFVRHALLKFDTASTVPGDATIRSAKLTLTVKQAGGHKRPISAYQIAESFEADQATWRDRKDGSRWKSAGGFLGAKYATVSAAASRGSKITFDLTRLVQATVSGEFTSRYTRVALIDEGTPSRDSYREYYSTEATDPRVRPALTVVYTVPSRPVPDPDDDDKPAPAPAPAPAPPPNGGTTSTLRLVHWNSHHGRSSNGKYDPDRIAASIAKMQPDVVSLNEVERFSDAHGDEDQPARYARLLQEKTGRRWYHHFATRDGGSSGRGQGNLLLSRYRIDAAASLALACDRSAALTTLHVNGRAITVVSTHLSNESSGCRATQASELRAWLTGFAAPRVIAGDWNSTQQRREYTAMLDGYYDAWAKAKASGDAIDYPNNTRDGATHTWRIDYVFYSKTGALALQKAQVLDTRGADGVRASDHKPLLVTFTVK